MESEKTSVALGHVLRALAFCVEPIILVLWMFKALFRLLTWPLRTPWHVVMWCLDATIMLVVEYKPFLIYLTFAVISGTLCGALAGVLTARLASWLPLVFPFLRRRRSRRPPLQRRSRNRRHGVRRPPQPQAGTTATTTTAPAAAPAPAVAAAAKPRPRHVASALTWSSDEEESVPGPLVPPPTFFHKGLTARDKAKAVAPGAGAGAPPSAGAGSSSSSVAGPSTSTSTSTWFRGSRHRAQQPVKVKVRVGDTIHEESSVSEDQGVVGGLKGKR